MSSDVEQIQTDAVQRQVENWLTANLGKVVSISRQARWRPMWFADVEIEGTVTPVCVRGDRVDTIQTFPLEHEMLAQSLMHSHGIKVPRVYGWIDGVRAFVMERIPGIATFDNLPEDQRRALMREYMHELARLHKVPIEAAEAAEVMGGRDPAAASRFGIERYEWKFRKLKRRPDAFIEFMLGWFRRNPLRAHDRRALVAWDTGQFHQLDGRLQALIDLELSHIGDPMMDLAGFRMRDTIMGYGDMNQLYRWYEEEAGTPVDLNAIQYYNLFFTLTNNLSFHVALAEPTPESDFMTNTQWINETNRFAVEALAEIMEVDLPIIELPEPEDSPWTIPFAHLTRTLKDISTDDELLRYKLRGAFRLTRHLARVDEIGRELLAANLDDIGDLTGKRPQSWTESEAILEQFVLADDGKHDLELLLLFNLRHQRAQALNGPAGSAMARHNSIQMFGGKM